MSAKETALTATQPRQEQTSKSHKPSQNVGTTERYVSAIGGGALALYGLSQRSLPGVALALVGGALVYRGTTGHCNVYEAAGIDTAKGGKAKGMRADEGIKVEKSITINRPPEELYRFWRNFENLPRIMDHLESVKVLDADGKRSHWVAKAPAGTSVEWDAEIFNEIPNELIAWRSLEGADVTNVGSVNFIPATGGRGTVVRVSLKYDPPGGVIGAAIAKLFGENPEQQVDGDLKRFKQVMETGEIPTTEGQSHGGGDKGTTTR